MRTVLIEKKVYKFDELDEKAKDKVRETFADDVWYDMRYEDFSEIANILGITFNTCERGKHTDISIWWSGFYCQRDGLSFDGTYSYSKKAPKRMKAYCNNPELIAMAQELQDIQKPFIYGLSGRIRSKRNNWITLDLEDTNNPYRDVSSAEKAIHSVMMRFCRWMYDALREEYEYQTSDEAIRESCEANGYEFYENGSFAAN